MPCWEFMVETGILLLMLLFLPYHHHISKAGLCIISLSLFWTLCSLYLYKSSFPGILLFWRRMRQEIWENLGVCLFLLRVCDSMASSLCSHSLALFSPTEFLTAVSLSCASTILPWLRPFWSRSATLSLPIAEYGRRPVCSLSTIVNNCDWPVLTLS